MEFSIWVYFFSAHKRGYPFKTFIPELWKRPCWGGKAGAEAFLLSGISYAHVIPNTEPTYHFIPNEQYSPF